MYEKYTRQSLPDKEYRSLLGSALCVFDSNNSFMIEIFMSLGHDESQWYLLMNMTSGRLCNAIGDTIKEKVGEETMELFKNIVEARNRIIHGFQATKDGKQVLVSKDKENNQTEITEDYLYNFISNNEKLALMLNEFRINGA